MAIFDMTAGQDNAYKALVVQARAYIPVTTSFNAQTLFGSLKKCIQKYIHQTISREFYEYVDGHTNEYPAELIDMIRRSVFNLAFSDYSSTGNILLSNVGFTEMKSNTEGPARLELIAKFQNKTFEDGIKELDEILYFIESQMLIAGQESKYTLYANSIQKSNLGELLIQTAKEFDDYLPINSSRIVFNSLRQDLKYVEKRHIAKLLYGLYQKVLEKDGEQIVFLTDNFIKPALAHLSIARAVPKLTAILGLYGTITIFDNTANNYARTHKTAPLEILNQYQSQIEQQGQRYLTDMVEYIKENPEDFVDYPHDEPIDFDEDDSHADHNHPRLFVM